MACIDKTYITSYQQYKEVANWAKSVGTVTDQFGNKLTPYDWIKHIIDYNDTTKKFEDKGIWTEEYYNDVVQNIKDFRNEAKLGIPDDTPVEVPLWSTDLTEDIWLIRNCPIDFIQDRLKFQYGEDDDGSQCDYYSIKNHSSRYDNPEHYSENNE